MNSRFGLQALLVISLAFNIAFVVMHFLCMPPAPLHGPEAFEERATHQMDPADAAVVHAAFAKHRDEFMHRRQIMDEAIAGVRAVLAADTLDQQALKAALDKARAARAVSEEVMEQTMLDAATGLTPKGRTLLVPAPPPHDNHGPANDGPPPTHAP